jgi:transposase InsO family protein
VSQLRDLQALPAGDMPRAKTFRGDEPGLVHVDIKYLPQKPDDGHPRCLFVAIDRATRWVFVHIYADRNEASSCDFLWRLYQAALTKISKILTDNGSQFADRFTGKTEQPSGKHAFDKCCAGLEIEPRLAPPRHPRSHGMVGRFSGRITEVIGQTRFKSGAELEAMLSRSVQTYNHRIPQRALDHQWPSRHCRSGVQTSQRCSRSG